jgi:hypothetical protein
MKNYATCYTYLDKEKEHTPKEQKEKKNGNRRSKRKEERKCRRISTLLIRGFEEKIYI